MPRNRIPKLPQLLDRKIYKSGQTRGADDDEIYQNRVGRTSTVLIPYHFWEGIAWKDWNEFYVCELPLQKGENLIKIEKVDASTDGTNIDYIVLLTAN